MTVKSSDSRYAPHFLPHSEKVTHASALSIDKSSKFPIKGSFDGPGGKGTECFELVKIFVSKTTAHIASAISSKRGLPIVYSDRTTRMLRGVRDTV